MANKVELSDDEALLEAFNRRGQTPMVVDNASGSPRQMNASDVADIDAFLERRKLARQRKSKAQQTLGTPVPGVDDGLDDVQAPPPPGVEEGEGTPTKRGVPQVTPPPGLQSIMSVLAHNTAKASDWLASRPTPGGIGAMLIAIFFFLWVIIPVNSQGYTRAYLLWLTLTGRTTLQGAQTLQPSEGPSLPLPTGLPPFPTVTLPSFPNVLPGVPAWIQSIGGSLGLSATTPTTGTGTTTATTGKTGTTTATAPAQPITPVPSSAFDFGSGPGGM